MKTNSNRLLVILLFAIVGMVQVANAFYDPGLQRWINRDPLGDVASQTYQTASIMPWEDPDDDEVELTEGEFQEAWIRVNRNLYGTMANNPVNMIDPLGLAELPCGGGPGSMNPANLEALEMRSAGEIARAAAERAKQKLANAVGRMVKQAAKDGPKSVKKSMESFKKSIAKHEKLIKENPNSKSLNFWKKEIENIKIDLEAAEKVLNACPKP